MAQAQTSTVKSAMRTLDIIEFVVAHHEGVVAQDIAEALGIPVSSLSYLLSTLVEREYLVREGRTYSCGKGLDRLRLPTSQLSLAERMVPQIKALRLLLDETVSFFTLAGWEVEAVITDTSEQALRYSISPHTKAPLHCMAAGKALLATLDADTLKRYFAEAERARFTPFTISDETALRAQIEAIRQSGIAETDEEHTLGVCGLGRSVLIAGEVVGALSVAIPKPRCTPEIRDRVRSALKRFAAAADLE